MSSLCNSIVKRWRNTPALVALVPYSRVYVGRMPTTEEKRWPYVSIIEASGGPTGRTNKTETSTATISFHIWVDGQKLAEGEAIEEEVRAAYANESWDYAYGTVRDVLDQGPGVKHQPDDATYQPWEIVKIFVFHLEQARRDSHRQGCETDGSDESFSITDSISSESSESLSVGSASDASEDISSSLPASGSDSTQSNSLSAV